MEVSLKTDLRFPIPGQQGHRDRIIQHDYMTWKDYGNDCHEEGFAEGLEKGREVEKIELIENMIRKGKTPLEIADFCGLELDLIEQVQESILSKN